MSYREMVDLHSKLRKEFKEGEGDSYSLNRMIELGRSIKYFDRNNCTFHSESQVGNYEGALKDYKPKENIFLKAFENAINRLAKFIYDSWNGL